MFEPEDHRFMSGSRLAQLDEIARKGKSLHDLAADGELKALGVTDEDRLLTPRARLLPAENRRIPEILRQGWVGLHPAVPAAEALRAALLVLDSHPSSADASFGAGALLRAQALLNEVLLEHPVLMDAHLQVHIFAANEYGVAPTNHAVAMNLHARFPRASDEGVGRERLAQWLAHPSVARSFTAVPAPGRDLHPRCNARTPTQAMSVAFSSGLGRPHLLVSLQEIFELEGERLGARNALLHGYEMRGGLLPTHDAYALVAQSACSASGTVGPACEEFLAMVPRLMASIPENCWDSAPLDSHFLREATSSTFSGGPWRLAGSPGDRLHKMAAGAVASGIYSSKLEFAEALCGAIHSRSLPAVSLEDAASFVAAAREIGVDYTPQTCEVRYGCLGQKHVFMEAARILVTEQRMRDHIDSAPAAANAGLGESTRRRRATL